MTQNRGNEKAHSMTGYCAACGAVTVEVAGALTMPLIAA